MTKSKNKQALPDDHQAGSEEKEPEIIVEKGEAITAISRELTQLDEAILEFGRSLYKDSLSLSLEFHKTMLGLTATFSTVMASVFALLVFGSENQQIGLEERRFLIAPIFVMLMSSMFFAFGYYPRRSTFSLNNLSSIREARQKLMMSRWLFAILGCFSFGLSISILIFGILFLYS
jgi:hypothetical protein